MKEAKRLHSIKEYYFSTKLREIAAMREKGMPVINLGIGSPDLSPSEAVLKALTGSLHEKGAHQYQSYRGTAALREAISGFYRRHYGVDLAAAHQILPLMGAKEGIMHISMAFLNEGDEVLLPDPGYLTYTSATLLAGGRPVYYPLTEAGGYLPDLQALAQKDLSRVKLMWVNYPHMPTGTSGSLALFEQLVAFAKQHQILLVNDNPYSFILTKKPLSILQVPGAMQVAMELNSLSKSHNMAGWRVGFLSGSQEHIDTVVKFKSQMDSGMFYGVQQAAVAALNLEASWYENINKTYSRRKYLVLEIVDKLGLSARVDQVGLFVWAKLPAGENSKDFTDRLLYDKHIFLAPGFIFGKESDHYVRLSLTVGEETLREVIRRVE